MTIHSGALRAAFFLIHRRRGFGRFMVLVWLLAACGRALAGPPPLMLATAWQKGDDPTGWWLSEKYDGMRGYWDGTRMWTRGGGVIALPDDFRAALPPFAVDGELWAGRGRFAETVSAVRTSEPGPGWRDIRYLIFDAPLHHGPFEARIDVVERWLAQRPPSPVGLATQTRCTGREHLERVLDEIEARGGEGVMLRGAGSPYEPGRGTHLRKYKRFDDAEAKVVGYKPGRGKYAGLVGSLQVELPDGTRFFVGSGLNDAERRDPPTIGSTITFRHHGWTRHGKPRFPTYWRVREP